MFEMARYDDTHEEVFTEAGKALRDYDAAFSRFNSATDEALINLAVFDMNAAMKRYCFIVKSVKEELAIEK